MEYKSDIMIAQECDKRPIREIAAKAGIDEKYLEQYGNYKARSTLACFGISLTGPTASSFWSPPSPPPPRVRGRPPPAWA